MKLSEMKNYKNTFTTEKPLYKLERRLNAKTLFWITSFTIATMVLMVFLHDYIKGLINDPQYTDFNNYFWLSSLEAWGVFGILYGSLLGYSIIASNFNNGSSTMLYTLNLSRNKILNNKLIRVVINIILFNIIVAISTFGIVAITKGIKALDLVNYLIYTLMMTAITLSPAILSFAITTYNHKKGSIAMSLIIPFVLTTISLLPTLDTKLSWLAYVSPLSMIITDNGLNILANGFSGVNIIAVCIWCFVPLFILPFGYIKFNKSDLV